MFSKIINQHHTDLLLLLVLFLLATIPFFDILIRTDQLIYNSDINYFFPHEIINRKLLSTSMFPLWNPYFGAGSPQLGKIQAGLLYPPSILLRGLPVVQMFNWDAILHLFFAGAGIFLLLRHWQVRRIAAFTGAVIFMFSGAILPRIMIGHVSIVHTVAWTGWILLAFDRLIHNQGWANFLLTIWFTLLIILGGHPQMSVLVLLIPVTYFLFVILPMYFREKAWKKIGRSLSISLLVAIFSIGLLSVQLFPFLEWLNQTSRGQGNAINTVELMTNYSLNFEHLISLFMPIIWFSRPLQKTISFTGFTHFWEASPFIPVTGSFLLILGIGSASLRKHPQNRRIIRYLIGLAIVGLLMSMGKQNPIYEILYSYYPFFRAPGRFLIWWGFALALLAGFTLDDLPKKWATNRRQFKIGQQTAVIILILCLSLWAGFSLWGSSILDILASRGTITENFSLIARETIPFSLHVLTVTTIGIILLFWLGQTKRLNRSQWELALVLLILAESFAFSKSIMRPYPVSNLYQDNHPLAQLSMEPSEIRIDGYRLPPNYHIPTLNHVLNGEEYFALERLLKEGGAHARRLLAADFLATREPVEDVTYTLSQKVENGYLYEHTGNLPRLYAATSVLPVKSDDEALAFVLSEQFNAEQQAIITLQDGELPPNLPIESPDPAAYTAKYSNYANNSITAEVKIDRPVLILFSEIYYPGWEATVNEKPVPIYRSNYTFRGIALEAAGAYQIEMQFRPRIFYNSLTITGFTIILILFLSLTLPVVKWLRKKKYLSDPSDY